ncbi:MAG TPA: YciI family protein [Streptosporangiaceae bacterium]|nr:YciI family protein [Streptosporangiaceae bacterium]
MKYVMLIFNTPASSELTAEERQAWSSEIFAWYEKQSGTGTLPDGGAQLQGPETARTLRATGVTDGPFMETKEVLGGYSVLETDTYDQAVEISKTWPGVDRGLITIELRPVVQF